MCLSDRDKYLTRSMYGGYVVPPVSHPHSYSPFVPSSARSRWRGLPLPSVPLLVSAVPVPDVGGPKGNPLPNPPAQTTRE